MGVQEFIVLVTGDRNWSNGHIVRERLREAVLGVNKEVQITLIDGGATGADTLSENAAKEFGWNNYIIRPRWDLYGKGAGPIRNSKMLRFAPDVILAFHDDLSKSRGTADMVGQATAAGRRVILCDSSGGRRPV